MPIIDLLKDEKRISVIGLAKNTGKTVTLNKILSELNSENIFFGLTSIGRDGEEFDVIDYKIKKPLIYVSKGNYVATTDALFDKSKAEVKIHANTDFRTPLGTILIGEVLKGGHIEIAGPSTTMGVKTVCDIMSRLGAKLVFIDGAINRKAASSSHVCDGTIVATGATLGLRMSMVVDETKHNIQLFTLPEVEDPKIKKIALEMNGTFMIDDNYRVVQFDNSSVLGNGHIVADKLTDNIRYIVFKKSLVESIVTEIIKVRKGNPLTLIVNDSTKVFLSKEKWPLYRKKGISIEVLHPANLILLTVNPISPQSHKFDSDRFVSVMRNALPDIPVCDVMNLNSPLV